MSEGPFVSVYELDRRMAEAKANTDAAIAKVQEDIRESEDRLRLEFTQAIRYEGDRTATHLHAQDGKLDQQGEKLRWIIGLILFFQTTVIGGLIYIAWSHHGG